MFFYSNKNSDCCDGTDEWVGYVKCPNTCEELGRKTREEAERKFAVQREGYQKLQQLIKEGKKLKEEKQVGFHFERYKLLIAFY